MKVESIGSSQNMVVIDSFGKETNQAQTATPSAGLDPAVSVDLNYNTKKMSDTTDIQTEDEAQQELGAIQTSLQNGGSLDGLHNLNLERVLRLLN